MKKVRYIIMLFILGSAAAFATAPPDTVKSAPGITVETSVDKSEIYIGDLIAYRLTIYHDSNIVLTPPPVGANLGAFDVKDYQVDESSKLKDGRIKLESRFLLTTFTTGDYIIPPIPIQFKLPDGQVKYLISEPTPIRVKSLLAESKDTTDIRDVKGPLEFKSSYALYYYIGAGALLLILAAAYIFWRIRRKRRLAGEPVDLRKPWEIAFEDLAHLKEKSYPADGNFKLYYIDLTEIIRAYLGRIYKIPVLDMTTEEFLGHLRDENVAEELYGRIKSFLSFGDLVKFAKLTPEMERINLDFDEAVAIVEYIRQKEMTAIPAVTNAEPVESGGAHV